jgi:hypothetical protein
MYLEPFQEYSRTAQARYRRGSQEPPKLVAIQQVIGPARRAIFRHKRAKAT